MAFSLPPTAPACDQGWCTIVKPLMEGLLALPASGCDVVNYIRANKNIILSWATHLSQPESPDPCSQAEASLFNFWRNFLSYGAAQIITADNCIYDAVRNANGYITGIQDKVNKPSVYADGVKCFGTIEKYPPPAKTTECAQASDINKFTVLRSSLEYYIIDILQLWLTAKSLYEKAITICDGVSDDEQCQSCMCEAVRQTEFLLAKLI